MFSLSFWQNIHCIIRNWIRRALGRPPLLTCWLDQHPRVACRIQWQHTTEGSVYEIPEAHKKGWPQWTSSEKAQLIQAFEAAWHWLEDQSGAYSSDDEDLPYPPVNVRDTSNDAGSAWTSIAGSYAWDLYLRWVALQLAVEIRNEVPWSVTTQTEPQLRVLFDSTAIMRRVGGGNYTIATGSPGNANFQRMEQNMGTTLIGPPWYTHAFLANENLIGATRLETIENLLEWISAHLVHYFGSLNYANAEGHWQYRGNPPVTRVIEGTVNAHAGTMEPFQHWTAGCHGTAGFIRQVLRAVNIPAHIPLICGHAQSSFTTEALYMDHGDNPYNQSFKASGEPAGALLIDHDTYTQWFGAGTDNRAEGCDKIGEQVRVLSSD